VGLVRVALHCEAVRAFKWLREHSFLPDSDRLSRGDPAKYDPLQELADRRRWKREALEALGAEGDGRNVRIPMRDADGNITGWKSRKADNSPFVLRDGSEVKSLTGKGEHNGLFYPDGLAEASDPVLVCEGEADTVAALSAGWAAVLGTAGASVGKDSAQDLARLLAGRAVLLCPDPDEAGRKWRDAVGRTLANVQAAVKYLSPDGNRDFDDRLRAGADLGEMVEGALEWEDPEDAFPQFFEKGKFIPLRLTRWIRARHELAFGFDAESGAGRLMEYVGGVWRPAVGLDVEGKDALGECANTGRVAEALRLLALDVPRVPWGRWNPNRRLINCKSGMLDPVDLKIRPHRPEDLSTFQIPVAWDVEATDGAEGDTHVIEFLGSVLPEDAVDLVAMMLGTCWCPIWAPTSSLSSKVPPVRGRRRFWMPPWR
jgi:putative DNA primase/helicase